MGRVVMAAAVVVALHARPVVAQPSCDSSTFPAYRPSIWLGHVPPVVADPFTARIRAGMLRDGPMDPVAAAVADIDSYRVSGDREALVRGAQRLAGIRSVANRPDVIVLLAATLEALGRPLQARETYHRLKNERPRSREGAIAAMRLAVTVVENGEAMAARPLLELARGQPSLRAVANYFLAWSEPSAEGALALLARAETDADDTLRAVIAHERCAFSGRPPTPTAHRELPEPRWDRAEQSFRVGPAREAWNACFAGARAESCLGLVDTPLSKEQREWLAARSCQLGSADGCRAALGAGLRAAPVERRLRWFALVWQSSHAREEDRGLAGVAMKRALRRCACARREPYRSAIARLPRPLDVHIRRLRALRDGRSPESTEGQGLGGSPY